MPPLLQTIIISQRHDAMNLVSVETSNSVGASSACKKKAEKAPDAERKPAGNAALKTTWPRCAKHKDVSIASSRAIARSNAAECRLCAVCAYRTATRQLHALRSTTAPISLVLNLQQQPILGPFETASWLRMRGRRKKITTARRATKRSVRGVRRRNRRIAKNGTKSERRKSAGREIEKNGTRRKERKGSVKTGESGGNMTKEGTEMI